MNYTLQQNFPSLMAVFLLKCAWTTLTSFFPKKKNSFPFSQKHYSSC